MRIAFYKDKSHLFDKFVSFWTQGIYSHCEVIITDGPITSPQLCASSSFRDNGVRLKEILLDPDYWDIIEVPGLDVQKSHDWFESNTGCAYDTIGLLSPFAPVTKTKNAYFCSEAIMCSIGSDEGWRFTPNAAARVFEIMGGQWVLKNGHYGIINVE